MAQSRDRLDGAVGEGSGLKAELHGAALERAAIADEAARLRRRCEAADERLTQVGAARWMRVCPCVRARAGVRARRACVQARRASPIPRAASLPPALFVLAQVGGELHALRLEHTELASGQRRYQGAEAAAAAAHEKVLMQLEAAQREVGAGRCTTTTHIGRGY